MDYLAALIINIVGNMVMPIVQKAIVGARRFIECVWNGPLSLSEPAPISDQVRTENRHRLRRAFETASRNANCLLVLIGVLCLPFAVKALPGRLIGASPARVALGLPELAAPLSGSPFLVSLVAALLLFFPMMFLSRFVARVLARRLSRFYEVKDRRFDALVALVFLMLTALLGCHLVYVLFSGVSYASAVVTPLALMSIFMMSNLGQSREGPG